MILQEIPNFTLFMFFNFFLLNILRYICNFLFRMNRIRLYLVRHGQTDYNLKHLLQGSGINSSLNQTGQNEAEKLKNTGKLLMKTDMIYSSPLERAVQTGEIVTGLKRDRNGRSKSLQNY